MKKAVAGFLFLTVAALLGAQTGAPGTAVIREVNGTVEVKAPGASEWKAASAGQILDRAALISTGFKSTARISIGNSDITVRPLTRLGLEELIANQESERVTLNLRAGRVRADVKPPTGGKTDFTIRATTATASVRGTVFEFDGTRLRVEEGRVHLGGASVTGAYVGKGHATTAEQETGKTAAAPSSAGLGIRFGWNEE
jgi:hypothetical protein